MNDPFDMSDPQIQRLLEMARNRGYITIDDLSAVLPSDITLDEIEATIQRLQDAGINVIESESDLEFDFAPPRLKTVGVIGGMGPAATLDFFERILKRTKALRDQDHIRLIIDSNTQVPDRNAASEGRGPSPAPALIASARGLEASGADFIVMACNAAHGWEADIRNAIGVPFLSMVQVTLEVLASLEPRPRYVGILAADGALNAQIYQRALTRGGFTPLVLEAPDQRAFMETLYRIKSGDVGAASKASFRSLGERLIAQGAQAVIAGCTEVPLVLAQSDLLVPLVSSTDALVERVIVEAGAELKAE